jgi:hypothetical protein
MYLLSFIRRAFNYFIFVFAFSVKTRYHLNQKGSVDMSGNGPEGPDTGNQGADSDYGFDEDVDVSIDEVGPA